MRHPQRSSSSCAGSGFAFIRRGGGRKTKEKDGADTDLFLRNRVALRGDIGITRIEVWGGCTARKELHGIIWRSTRGRYTKRAQKRGKRVATICPPEK